MLAVTSLRHVGLFVRDIERSKAFYRDMLGLKISDENPKTGSTFMTAKDRLEEHHELLLVPGVLLLLVLEFIEQHRCQLLIPDGFNLALGVAGYEFRIDFRHLLGNQSVLPLPLGVLLVAKGDRAELE